MVNYANRSLTFLCHAKLLVLNCTDIFSSDDERAHLIINTTLCSYVATILLLRANVNSRKTRSRTFKPQLVRRSCACVYVCATLLVLHHRTFYARASNENITVIEEKHRKTIVCSYFPCIFDLIS